jgi:AcrR family transcriptional regulator
MEKTSSVRNRIIDTSCRLFYDQGYQATGINQIIEEANIAKSSLYQHFKSKEELLVEYLTTINRNWFESFNKLTLNAASAEKNILSLFDYRKESAIKNHFKGCAFIRLAYELPNRDAKIAELISRHKLAVKAFIAKQVELLELVSEEEKNELIEMIYTLYEGCGIESTIQNSLKPIETSRAIVKRLIR